MRCVSYGSGGSFCALPCEDDAGCPDQYSCKDGYDFTLEPTRACYFKGDACECSGMASYDQASTPCFNATESGKCSGSRVCDEDGLSACSAPVPIPEICDGLDNDCDGEVDEESAGDPCVVEGELGSCEGTMECIAGVEVCSASMPVPELCDGLDNDCNGEVDELFSDTDSDGLADCVDDDDDGDSIPDSFDNCPTVAGASQLDTDGDGDGNLCDLDDDDDGEPDDTDCAPAVATVHPGAEEVCDGLDNDCSGTADELFPDTDSDSLADCVDADDDDDAVLDGNDNCPLHPNPSQADIDQDGVGDVCDW